MADEVGEILSHDPSVDEAETPMSEKEDRSDKDGADKVQESVERYVVPTIGAGGAGSEEQRFKARDKSFDELNGTSEVELVNGEPVIRNGNDVSRFIVSTRDDGDDALTFRSIVLGTIFTAFSSTITIIYIFKPVQTPVQVSFVFLLLLVYIAGIAWYRLTPKPESVKWPWLQKTFRFLNFGQPFLLKEHVVASLIASSGNNGLVGVENFAVQRLYYSTGTSIPYSTSTVVLSTFSICLCGFVLAGLLRTWIVYPAEMVYWSTLPQVVLLQNLHKGDAKPGGGTGEEDAEVQENKKRMRKFGWWFGGSFVWELFPSYIMPWLNGLSVFCLASIGAPTPTREVFATIFGGGSSNEGVGLFNLTLDWQYIQSTYLSLPLKLQANSWIGYGIWYVVMLALYYGDAFGAKGLPFMSTSLFQANGKKYSVTSIFGSGSTIIDESKLGEAGLPHLTATTVWGYFTATLAIGALISHVIIFYSKDMIRVLRQAREGSINDPHYQGMRKYKEVPLWWYGVLFLLAFVAGIIVNAKGETTLPIWAYIVSLILGAFLAPFCECSLLRRKHFFPDSQKYNGTACILYGLFGTGIDTKSLPKMIAGAMIPGRPLANLYFVAWSHQVILLSVNLANWQKLGQYTKVPHRIMFATQIYASLLGAAFNYLVMTTIVSSQREQLLDPSGGEVWSGQQMASLNTSAVTWALAKEGECAFQDEA